MKTTILLIIILLLVMTISAFTKEINEKVSIDFSHRFRMVTWDNVDLDNFVTDGKSFSRHRTSLGASWTPNKYLKFRVKLTNEFRYYFVNELVGTPSGYDEVIFDQLYAKINNPFDIPVTLTVGRQNIILGEGFVVMEGHPYDGSRSIYFNAIRIDWRIKEKHQLTGFVSRIDKNDNILPVIHNQDKLLVWNPNRGFGFYYSGDYDKFNLETYYINKQIRHRYLSNEKSSETIGSRIQYKINNSMKLTVEYARQFGKHKNISYSSSGGHGYLNWNTGWERINPLLPSAFRVGMVYLSGNNRETDEDEGWDPVYARWPKWSESYIYTLIFEEGVANWTNLISLNANVSFEIDEGVNFQMTYHHLMASALQSPFSYGDGKTRGDLLISKLSFSFGKYWSGHILWERFKPGDFYLDIADGYSWARAELMFRY